jgi:hypothetical protein
MSTLLDEASHERITLDFAGAKDASDIVENLSGAAAIGNYLWTVSDEGRRLECLIADGSGYKLNAQYKLDELFDTVASGAGSGCAGRIASCARNRTTRKTSLRASCRS